MIQDGCKGMLLDMFPSAQFLVTGAAGPGGGEASCEVLADFAGASYSDDVFGDKLRKAFDEVEKFWELCDRDFSLALSLYEWRRCARAHPELR